MHPFIRAFAGLLALAGGLVAAPVAPYPPSALIRSLDFHWETYTNAAIGSDLWPITWGPDDNLYTAWGDGGGFGGGDRDGRVGMGFARIEGTPFTHWQGFNVNGGKNPEHPSAFPKLGKTGGLLCVRGVLYAIVNRQDGQWPNVNHVLAYSRDLGATWSTNEWLFTRGLGHFQPNVFLNFGRNDTGVPGSLRGYVYVYGVRLHEAAQVSPGTFLARVPETELNRQHAYEFYQGLDARAHPRWTPHFDDAVPALVDTNDDGIGAAVYAPALRRYLLSSFHGGPGQLGVFDGLNPWGPWTTVTYLNNFGGMGAEGEGLLCEFPQKWMSADNQTLWMVFSVYGGSAKQGINGHDRFNLLETTLQLYPRARVGQGRGRQN